MNALLLIAHKSVDSLCLVRCFCQSVSNNPIKNVHAENKKDVLVERPPLADEKHENKS